MDDPVPGRVEQDFVIPSSVDVDDEADSAGSLLVSGVVQPICLWQTPTVLVERHCSGLFWFKTVFLDWLSQLDYQ